MKRFFYLGIIALMASCSSSKYAAHFQKSSPDFGYGELVNSPVKTAAKPLSTTDDNIASTSKDAGIITNVPSEEAIAATVRERYKQLSAAEKKGFRKEVKKQIKEIAKFSKSEATMAQKKQFVIDLNLKLAAIFGTIGLIFVIVGGNVLWVLGVIGLVVGAVFFVLWVMENN